MSRHSLEEMMIFDKRFEELNSLKSRFHNHIAASPKTKNVPGSVRVEDDAIAIECFGHVVKAAARAVRDDDGCFYIEYDFQKEDFKGKPFSVYLVYLTRDGHLASRPSIDSAICDFNNQYIQDKLLNEVSAALLESVLFRPSDNIPPKVS